jgi:phage I-like protein
VTADDLETIANRFGTWAQEAGFAGLLVDFDHFSSDQDKSTRAGAWIMNVQRRDDTLWGQLRLTASGRAALEGGDFRHFSPVLGFPPRDYKPGEEAHPVALLGGAFTNQPTFRGMVPLSNRQGDPLASTQRTEMDYKAKLITVLGLAATASDAEVEAACVTLNSLVQKGREFDATKNRLDKLESEQIDRDLDAHGLQGEAREKWKGALTKNREEALVLLASIGKEGSGYARTHNRNKARTPDQADKTASDRDQKRDAAVAEYRTKNRCDFATAWDAVKAAQPELFQEAAAE